MLGAGQTTVVVFVGLSFDTKVEIENVAEGLSPDVSIF